MATNKAFWSNVLPSMAAFAFSGLYTIVDGFFIGQNIGDYGIAAVNIAYPITALIQAIGTGVGMAGAIWIAISVGENNEQKKNKFLGNTFILLALFSLCTTVMLTLLYRPLLSFFGAEGIILQYAADYLRIIVWGAAFQLCSVGLLPIIRNFGGAFVAMVAMIAGFVSNILGDWYFTSVLQWGTAGAAFATVLGQLIALLPCIAFLIRKRKLLQGAVLRLSRSCVRKICTTALAPFGSILSPMLVIIVMNKAAMAYGGENEVACYAVISYVIAMANLLMQGIGDGVQPLIGRAYGSGEATSLNGLQKRAFALGISTAAVCMLAFFASAGIIPTVFGASETVAMQYKEVLPYFLSGLLFVPVFKITSCYLYATGKIKLAYLLIYLEPILIALLAGGALPLLLGIQGVWMAVPITQLLIAAMSIVLLIVNTKMRYAGQRS